MQHTQAHAPPLLVCAMAGGCRDAFALRNLPGVERPMYSGCGIYSIHGPAVKRHCDGRSGALVGTVPDTMSVMIKICGITNPEDALAAVQAGVDALGFVFYPPSPRNVSLDVAARVAAAVPAHLWRVGVFVDPAPELVLDAIHACRLTLVQLHGAEAPEFCTRIPVPVMKAFRVRDESILDEIARYQTEFVLLDAYDPHAPGGTGSTFNWDLARAVVRTGRKVFLAGGLTPENVGRAIEHARPFGVDASSGVESGPGRKDHEKIRAFVVAARAAALRAASI